MTSAIKRQERSARWQRRLAGGVLAVAGGAPVLMAADVSGVVLVGALAAVVAPALIASFKSWGEATGSAERVKLHAATRSMLREAAAYRDEFDAAIAANDLPAAMAYAEKIFAALRTDVEGFLKIMGAAPTPTAPDLPTQRQ